MAWLAKPQNTIAVLQRYNFRFQKKFGQNFLIDESVIRRIVEGAGITKDDLVLEIGPGIGTMTQYMADAAGGVLAVEIDRNLKPVLEDTLYEYQNVEIIWGDILKQDLPAVLSEKALGRKVKVVANLPYYITTPIIMDLLEQRLDIECITVMIQKEVAVRMQAGPGSKDYGALSLAVQYYTEPEVIAKVPPNCFIPRPNVESAVIRLSVLDRPSVSVQDEKLLFKLIRASFNQRRKTLLNGLKNSPELSFTGEEIAAAIAAAGFDPAVRGEALTLTEFARLSDILSAGKTDSGYCG